MNFQSFFQIMKYRKQTITRALGQTILETDYTKCGGMESGESKYANICGIQPRRRIYRISANTCVFADLADIVTNRLISYAAVIFGYALSRHTTIEKFIEYPLVRVDLRI